MRRSRASESPDIAPAHLRATRRWRKEKQRPRSQHSRALGDPSTAGFDSVAIFKQPDFPTVVERPNLASPPVPYDLFELVPDLPASLVDHNRTEVFAVLDDVCRKRDRELTKRAVRFRTIAPNETVPIRPDVLAFVLEALVEAVLAPQPLETQAEVVIRKDFDAELVISLKIEAEAQTGWFRSDAEDELSLGPKLYGAIALCRSRLENLGGTLILRQEPRRMTIDATVPFLQTADSRKMAVR